MIKICGITNQEDSDAAVVGGATALGFNFYPQSPRYIFPELAAGIQSAPGVLRVGVFVDEDRHKVDEIARIAALDVAQLHGKETSAEYPASVPVWKAVRIGPEYNFADLRRRGIDPAQALLLDGPMSGVAFQWIRAKRFHSKFDRTYRIIIAGGLDASNVAAAVAAAHPWGVDACSRIESAPGRKDLFKMSEFLEAARKALSV